MCFHENKALKKSWHQKMSKTHVQKMKFSKFPDTKISLDKRYQKVCSKNWSSQKVLMLIIEGLKLRASKMCLKKMKPSKSPDVKIFLDRRYQKCVFKKRCPQKNPDVNNFLHWRSQKCVFEKMKVLIMRIQKKINSRNMLMLTFFRTKSVFKEIKTKCQNFCSQLLKKLKFCKHAKCQTFFTQKVWKRSTQKSCSIVQISRFLYISFQLCN